MKRTEYTIPRWNYGRESDGAMEISTYEAWEDWIVHDRQRRAFAYAKYVQSHPEILQRHLRRQYRLDRKREDLLVDFPYVVIAEGEYSEHDYACRWCWQQFGPENGRCKNYQSEYPACPLVLETEHIEEAVRKDRKGTEISYRWKAYSDPGEHSHQGVWTTLWFGKTAYDYGFNVYFFVNEADHERFLGAFPTFTWHGSWDKEDVPGGPVIETDDQNGNHEIAES